MYSEPKGLGTYPLLPNPGSGAPTFAEPEDQARPRAFALGADRQLVPRSHDRGGGERFAAGREEEATGGEAGVELAAGVEAGEERLPHPSDAAPRLRDVDPGRARRHEAVVGVEAEIVEERFGRFAVGRGGQAEVARHVASAAAEAAVDPARGGEALEEGQEARAGQDPLPRGSITTPPTATGRPWRSTATVDVWTAPFGGWTIWA